MRHERGVEMFRNKVRVIIGVFSTFFLIGAPSAYALSATLSGPYAGCANFDLKVTFDQAVSGFEEADLALVNATAGPASGGPLEYIVPITATGDVVFVELPADSAINDASEGNTPSNVLKYKSQAWERGTQTGLFDITVTFSEPVNSLELGDFVVSAGALTGLSGGPEVYTLNVEPPVKSTGTLQVDLPAGAAVDYCGNLSLAAPQKCVPFDTVVKLKSGSAGHSDLGSMEPKAPGVPVVALPGLAALAALLGLVGARNTRKK